MYSRQFNSIQFNFLALFHFLALTLCEYVRARACVCVCVYARVCMYVCMYVCAEFMGCEYKDVVERMIEYIFFPNLYVYLCIFICIAYELISFLFFHAIQVAPIYLPFHLDYMS